MADSTYDRIVLTDAGAALLNKAQAGECQLELVRVDVGTGTWDDTTTATLRKATALKTKETDFPIASRTIVDSVNLIIGAYLTNRDVADGFFINEIGIVAKEKDVEGSETLYSIAVCSGEHGSFLPAYNGSNPVKIFERFYVTVDNSATVTIDVGSDFLSLDTYGIAGDPGELVLTQDIIDRLGGFAASMREATEQEILDILNGEHYPDDDTGMIDTDGTVIEEATDEEVRDFLSTIWADQGGKK